MLYIAIYAVFLAVHYTTLENWHARRSGYICAMLALFVFSAFRFEVGCDWRGYLYQYTYWDIYTEQDGSKLGDPLWWLLIRVMSGTGLPYPWLNVVSSGAFFLGLHQLAKRQPDPFAVLLVAFPVLVLNMPMSGIRQGASIGALCVALAAFSEERPVRFVVWTLIASSLHSSAAVFLLLSPLCAHRLSLPRLALAALLAAPGLYFLLGSGAAEVAVGRYVKTDSEAGGAAFRVALVAATGLLFLVALRRRWLERFPRDYHLALLGSWGMLLVTPLLLVSTVIADRFGYYFVPILAVILARIPWVTTTQRQRSLQVAAFAALGMVLVVWVLASSLFEQCYVPYKTWLLGTPHGRWSSQ